MRVNVFGGLHHGRVLDLPEGTREGDLVELPIVLPAGEMHSRGRTQPELHRDSRMYEVVESADRGKYLANRSLRFVRMVEVPQVPALPVIVTLR